MLSRLYFPFYRRSPIKVIALQNKRNDRRPPHRFDDDDKLATRLALITNSLLQCLNHHYTHSIIISTIIVLSFVFDDYTDDLGL